MIINKYHVLLAIRSNEHWLINNNISILKKYIYIYIYINFTLGSWLF